MLGITLEALHVDVFSFHLTSTSIDDDEPHRSVRSSYYSYHDAWGTDNKGWTVEEGK